MADLLTEVERVLGNKVDSVEPIDGGYTPQRVSRLYFANGEAMVLKAAPPASVDARLDWPGELQREIELYASHPELDRWRPQPRAALANRGWRGLLMEDLGESMRPPPWTGATVSSVAAGLAAMHGSSIEAGHQTIHGDVRSDNLFLVPGRGLVLCDWAEATQGPALEDAVYWAVGVELEGGGPARDAFARYAAVTGDPSEAAVHAAATRLFLLNRQRLDRTDEPVRVRELRIRELAVLEHWLSA
jgi:hypothetical protein